MFTLVSIVPLIDMEDACLDLNAARSSSKAILNSEDLTGTLQEKIR